MKKKNETSSTEKNTMRTHSRFNNCKTSKGIHIKIDYHEIRINNLPKRCSDLFTCIHFQKNKKVRGVYLTDASGQNVECVNFDGFVPISTEKKPSSLYVKKAIDYFFNFKTTLASVIVVRA